MSKWLLLYISNAQFTIVTVTDIYAFAILLQIEQL